VLIGPHPAGDTIHNYADHMHFYLVIHFIQPILKIN